MTKTIEGIIEKAEVFKSGMKNGKVWTLYNVIINGDEFKSFDAGYLEIVGKEGKWVYEEEERVSPKGTTYISRTLDSVPKDGSLPSGKEETQEPNTDKLIQGLGVIRGDIKQLSEKIETKLENIEVLLENINFKTSGDSENIKKPKGVKVDLKEEEIPIINDEQDSEN